MRSGALVPVALVVVVAIALLATCSSAALTEIDPQLPSQGEEGYEGGSSVGKPWPCCDNCGSCTRSIPPLCTCNDNLLLSCPPLCVKCVKSPLKIYPQRYICLDRIANYCEKRCTPKPPISTV